MFVMVLNRWKCLFNFVILFMLRGIFFNFNVLLSFFGKLSRFLIGVVWFVGLGVCVIFCWGKVEGGGGGGGGFWGGIGVFFCGFDWMIILFGIGGILGFGVVIFGIEKED